MPATNKIANAIPTRLPLNIAIVGGGKACKFFLELLQTDYFKSLDINLVGVCDIDSEAEGLQMAEKMGIYTTDNFKDFFELKDLDSIIELTNSRDVLLDLVKLRPKGVGVLEHNIGQFFRLFYNVDQQLKSAEYQASLQKMFSDFLIQQSNEAIVVLNTDFTIMSSELERCGNIVTGLLSFSRDCPLAYKNIIFNEIIDAVTRLTRHKMELQNIRLVTDFQAGIAMVKGDANRLQQVLLNLIFNAIEAMPDGGELCITSRLVKKKKEIQIEIRDTGHGIPEKQINHIFDPFFTTKKEGEGTGLGLSIVYGVVNNHGGKIRAKSQENEGTVFILNFPVL